jgi:hypothetical protein
MAKPIPVKASKKKKPSATEIEKWLKKKLKDLDEEVDERYAWARKFMKGQDAVTQQAMQRLLDRMLSMAGPSTAYVLLPGDTERTMINVSDELQERNHYYFAVRMIVACAKMDIRIGKFKFPDICAEVDCGRKV